jgi:GH24 family phage-related lysozyme (muramidase)
MALQSPRAIGAAGVTVICHFEGCAHRRPDGNFGSYPDPGTGGAPWTIGWGSTGRDIRKGVVWTQAQCDARLHADLQRFAGEVSALIGEAPTTANQFDALVSFDYNEGTPNLRGSTLLRKHLAGDFAGARAEFGKWCHAGGKVLPGLVKRLAVDAALYAAPGPVNIAQIIQQIEGGH